MNFLHLKYFLLVAEELNITRAAERLYISQQTLSNHIQRLEQYYGTKLFYRKPSLSLTCAGEFVLSFAQVVGKEERNLKDILSDVEHQERGTLRFGASMARGTQFLPRILPDFHQMYPRVEVRFVEGLSQGLERQTSNGELDFALVLSAAIMAVGTVVFLAIPGPLLRLFDADAAVLAEGISALRLIALSFVCAGVSVILCAALQALGAANSSSVSYTHLRSPRDA